MCEHQVQEGGPEASRGMPMPDASELSYGPDHSVLGLDETIYTEEEEAAVERHLQMWMAYTAKFEVVSSKSA